MKYIITEEQSVRLKALRRIGAIEELVVLKLKEYRSKEICKYDKVQFSEAVMNWVIDAMYYDYFGELDDLGEEWTIIWNMYDNYMRTNLVGKIFDYYEKLCGKSSITESNLRYLRRISTLDDLIRHSLQMFDRWHFSYANVDYIIEHVATDVTELYFFRSMEDIEVSHEEYDELHDFLKDYLNKEWRDKIEKLIKYARQ